MATAFESRNSLSPHVVTWELTRSCALHCRHCRAAALRHRDPRELTPQAIEAVLQDLMRFERRPIMVFTGGDPLERPDLDTILTAAIERGFHTAMAPSVTPNLTAAVIEHWAKLGVGSVSLSLDGTSAPIHDGFRGQAGTFQATLQAASAVRQAGMKLQINSSVAPSTVACLEAMGALVQELQVNSWEVFSVIPTGRARLTEQITAWEVEHALQWLARYRASVRFRVTTVGAPQFRRVLEEDGQRVPAGPAVREAQGFFFINHIGEVCPSGYLPLAAGVVPHESAVDIYQHAPLFVKLRDPDWLTGGCGTCAYRETCGGSRARAFAVTGDWRAEDPGCLYSSTGA